jgi:hypothetical protein
VGRAAWSVAGGLNVTFKQAPKTKTEVAVKAVSVWDAAAGSDAVDVDDGE